MSNNQHSVLVIGGGGREHALVYYLSMSEEVEKIWVSPGNAGTNSVNKATNVGLNLNDHESVIQFCLENGVSLVVIGPEAPLANGLANDLIRNKISVFGPERGAAEIEFSKAWAKKFMVQYGIPTADHKIFDSLQKAVAYVDSVTWDDIVIKVSGLAGGKGVFLPKNKEEAKKILEFDIGAGSEALRDAAKQIILEKKLTGYEISVHALCDGERFSILPLSQDHKRRYEGDGGPNTGGMGAISNLPFVPATLLETIKVTVIERALDGLRDMGRVFRGVLYAGLMITERGPKVLEFNCRFGDPETQAILPLIRSDLYKILKDCADGQLDSGMLENYKDSHCCAISVVIAQYPESCAEGYGYLIEGLANFGDESDITIFFAGTKLNPNGQRVTSGGRVLTVCAEASSMEESILRARETAEKVVFVTDDAAFKAAFRRDIGFQARLLYLKYQNQEITYANAGVDIEKCNLLVRDIKEMLRRPPSRVSQDSIGGFAAIFELHKYSYKNPLLVSGTDGVGTKLKIAHEIGEHGTIGQDLVAMCVNDVIVCGAEPLFFLDYFSIGKLEVDQAGKVLQGIVDGCAKANCLLVGGETAEMPGMYSPGEYDLAGFVVGAVERPNVLPKPHLMGQGDLLIGIESSGLHSNGFSLVRKIVRGLELNLNAAAPFEPTQTLGHALLEPTTIYIDLLAVLREKFVLGAAHITGGGLPENVNRILPDYLSARIDQTWMPPKVFLWLFGHGISWTEMLSTFNLGIGVVLVVGLKENETQSQILDKINAILLEKSGDRNKLTKAFVIGSLVQRVSSGLLCSDQIKEHFLNQAALLFCTDPKCFPPKPNTRRVAVLISGSGTNLQALIDHTLSEISYAQITLVISNIEGVQGLERAQKAGIPVKVISHRDYGAREDFEKSIHSILVDSNIEFVCLAGFMRILTGWFVDKWKGKMINIHPSLLPSFKGSKAQKQALDAGVKITGCTVHFVEEDVDCGSIIAQEAVQILPGDTVETLSDRIKEAEHRAFPRALESLVRGKVSR